MLICILPDLFSIARPFFEKYLNPVTMALFRRLGKFEYPAARGM